MPLVAGVLCALFPGGNMGARVVVVSEWISLAGRIAVSVEGNGLDERALAGGRLLDEQDIDVLGTFYLLMVGLVATDALDLAGAYWDRAFAEAEARGAEVFVAAAGGADSPMDVTLTITDDQGNTQTIRSGEGVQPALKVVKFTC